MIVVLNPKFKLESFSTLIHYRDAHKLLCVMTASILAAFMHSASYVCHV
jgi:hypothetical protein